MNLLRAGTPIPRSLVAPVFMRASAIEGTRSIATRSQPRYNLQAGKNRVAVLFSGAGVYDGTEIQEAVFALSRLSALNAATSCFAPDRDQMHAVNHLNGTPHESTRNCLQETARITRGTNTFALSELLAKIGEFDALIVPGGFGAAKNLCDFGPVGGPEFTVDPDVQKVIEGFHAAGKPIGLSCIAPVIAARVLGASKKGLKLSVGGETEGERWPYAGASGAIKALGCDHVELDIVEGEKGTCCVDAANKVATAPAYMCGTAKVCEVEKSMHALVDKTCEMIA